MLLVPTVEPLSMALLLLLTAVAGVPGVNAWGAAGHEIVATIAQIFLTPTARSTLCEILPASSKCHLGPIASWADRVRNGYTAPLHYVNGKEDWPADHCSFGASGWDRVRNGYTAPLHYVNGKEDWPADHCSFGASGWDDEERNVFVGIYNSTRNVAYLSGHERDFALRYLVHFMGDLHMPLHLVGRDKGGNKAAVRFDHRTTNLHSVWDSLLISKHIRTLTNYTEPLPSRTIESALQGAIYDSYVRFIVWEGILGWWRDEYLTWPSCPTTATSAGLAMASRLNPEPVNTIDVEVSVLYNDDDDDNDLITSDPGPISEQQHPLQGLITPDHSSHLPPPLSLESLPVCPLDWAIPIHKLNCNSTLIWPQPFSDIPPNRPSKNMPAKDLIQLDSPEYSGRIREELIIEKLLATAGVRLAAVLNELLDPLPVDDGGNGDGFVRVVKG